MIICQYLLIAIANLSAFESSLRDIVAKRSVEPPIPSSGTRSDVNFDEAVKSTSSGPCSNSGVWPLAVGEEHKRMMLLPVEELINLYIYLYI